MGDPGNYKIVKIRENKLQKCSMSFLTIRSGVRKEGSKVQGPAFRVDVFKRLWVGAFQPLNPEG